jgi:hypothetical protein
VTARTAFVVLHGTLELAGDDGYDDITDAQLAVVPLTTVQ